MAFWFASRGKGNSVKDLFTEEYYYSYTNEHCFLGHLVSEDGARSIDYESKARVILIGIGADELLGGYSRHREAFKHGGWARLISEVRHTDFVNIKIS